MKLLPSLFFFWSTAIIANVYAEGDESLGQLGDICGRRNPCAPGLDCMAAPVRKKCYPITCAVEALQLLTEKTDYDLGTYGQDMMAKAGVSESSDMFRQFPDASLNLFNRESDDLNAVALTIKNNPPDLDMFMESFTNCSRASRSGVTPYFGASWELGLLGTYNGDIFWGRGSADNMTMGVLNNCFGFVLGLDAGISGLLGIAFTGTINDLKEGCKQMFPIFAFPPFEIQIGFQDCDNPTLLIEMTVGVSASTGLPGYTTCTATAL